MADTTRAVRIDTETARLVKMAAAATHESMQVWISKACRLRLETDGKHIAADRRSVASVEFEDE